MNFDPIADRYPTEREAIGRLHQLLHSRPAGIGEYTLNRLCELVQPKSRETFALVLGELIHAGILRQIVRVISPATQGGIGDFGSIEKVPSTIHDWRTDTRWEVQPADLRILYVTSTAPSPDGNQSS